MFKVHKDKGERSRIYQVIGICLLCIAFAMMTGVTLSWFLDQSETSNGVPNITLIGTLELEVTTNFNFYNLSLQPDYTYTVDKISQPIGTYVKTKSGSKIHDIDGAFVRIKYTTERKLSGASEWVDNLDLLTLHFADDKFTTSTTYSQSVKNRWVYNSADGYYYYLGSIFTDFIEFNKGYTTSYKIGNEYKNAQVKIHFLVESIQRQYGAYSETWPTAPKIFDDFAYDEMKEGERDNEVE